MIVKIELSPVERIRILAYLDREGIIYGTETEGIEIWINDQVEVLLEAI